MKEQINSPVSQNNNSEIKKGRVQGSKNKPKKHKGIPDETGMALTGFTISNNRLRATIASEIGGVAALLYITLLAHRNTKTNKCFPTLEVLSREINFSKRKVSEAIGQLNDAGYIIVRSGGRHYANSYYFPYEEFFDPNDYEVMVSYRRKHMLAKSKEKGLDKILMEDIKKEFSDRKKEFEYDDKRRKPVEELYGIKKENNLPEANYESNDIF